MNRSARLALVPHNTSLSNEILLELQSASTNETSEFFKKHFNILKTSKSASLINDLKFKGE